MYKYIFYIQTVSNRMILSGLCVVKGKTLEAAGFADIYRIGVYKWKMGGKAKSGRLVLVPAGKKNKSHTSWAIRSDDSITWRVTESVRHSAALLWHVSQASLMEEALKAELTKVSAGTLVFFLCVIQVIKRCVCVCVSQRRAGREPALHVRLRFSTQTTTTTTLFIPGFRRVQCRVVFLGKGLPAASMLIPELCVGGASSG